MIQRYLTITSELTSNFLIVLGAYYWFLGSGVLFAAVDLNEIEIYVVTWSPIKHKTKRNMNALYAIESLPRKSHSMVTCGFTRRTKERLKSNLIWFNFGPLFDGPACAISADHVVFCLFEQGASRFSRITSDGCTLCFSTLLLACVRLPLRFFVSAVSFRNRL